MYSASRRLPYISTAVPICQLPSLLFLKFFRSAAVRAKGGISVRAEAQMLICQEVAKELPGQAFDADDGWGGREFIPWLNEHSFKCDSSIIIWHFCAGQERKSPFGIGEHLPLSQHFTKTHCVNNLSVTASCVGGASSPSRRAKGLATIETRCVNLTLSET